MIVDARELDPVEALRADVCIVGGGAAGITAALELSGTGLDVLLLEAGGRSAEPDAQDTYRGALTDGTRHAPLEMVRQKRLGGTTMQWGGRCAPLDPLDLAPRPWVTDVGWPVSHEELLPFWRRAHHYCDAGAFEYSVAEAVPGAAPFLAEGSPVLSDDGLWRWSPPVRFGRRYRRALESAPGVRVVQHANVIALRRDTLSGRVLRAVVGTGPERRLAVDAHVFVLAAGGLECARLLLASNHDTPAGIGNEHDLVGRHYMTHPVAEFGRVTLRDPARATGGGYLRSRDGVYVRRMLKLTAAAQERHALRNLAAALWYPDPRDPAHGDPLLSAYALVREGLHRWGGHWRSRAIHGGYRRLDDRGGHLANVARGLPSLARSGADWTLRRWLARRTLPSFAPPVAAGWRLRVDAEQSPDPANRAVLSRRRDRFGMPRLEVRHRLGADDRDSVLRSLRLIAAELEACGTGRLALDELDPGFETLAHSDGTHQMGLTRMADSPRAGVVDRHCRVHGAPNLYVASSAVFPTGGSAGPTLTVVAVAVRVAGHVRASLRQGAPGCVGT